jgi:hypothetical protein
MRILRLLLITLTLASALPARAATDYTDIWWNAGGTESGWGVNLAQNGDTIFATFFIYGPTNAPTWYVAVLNRTIGETFTGTVFFNTGGSWFGAPTWVPPAESVAGTASFVAQSPQRGMLTYTIGSTNVAKTIERQPLAPLNIAGTYLGAITVRRDGCTPPPTIFELDQFVVTQSASGTVAIDQLSTTDGALICRMEGTGVQYGGIIDIADADYNCPGAYRLRAHVIGLRPTATGFEARWFADFGGGCTETGNMTGATQLP